MTQKAVLLSSPDTNDFVELASQGQGRVFRKMILPMSKSFVHPNDPNHKILVDKEFAETLVRNFKDGICDTVQFPLVDEKNRHTEDPERNRGQVIDLSFDDKGVYATIDVRKGAEDVGTVILGASAMMNLNYTDTSTGRAVGPTLLHVAGTNRPYLTKLDPFEEIALSNADTDTEEVVLLTPETESETPMEKSVLIDMLKTEHGIDVEELEAKASGSGALVTALSNVLRAANPDVISLSAADEEVTIADIAEGVVALSRDAAAARAESVELSARVETFEKAQAEVEVDTAVREGKILPAQRDGFLEIRLSNPEAYAKIVPDVAVVSLSETGVTTHDRTPNPALDDATKEVERLAKVAQELG